MKVEFGKRIQKRIHTLVVRYLDNKNILYFHRAPLCMFYYKTITVHYFSTEVKQIWASTMNNITHQKNDTLKDKSVFNQQKKNYSISA